ncbi:hypothetical protein I9Y15_004930 [Serratia marcescens]|nr:hypothetical protein [Serratia marcescens]
MQIAVYLRVTAVLGMGEKRRAKTEKKRKKRNYGGRRSDRWLAVLKKQNYADKIMQASVLINALKGLSRPNRHWVSENCGLLINNSLGTQAGKGCFSNQQ